MVFQYYPETDMLYIQLTQEPSAESEEVVPGVVVDLDAQNRIIGIEIENAGKSIDLSRLELSALPISNLVLTERLLIKPE